MYKNIFVFICCVVLVSETVNSQVVSVEGVWQILIPFSILLDPFSLGFWFVNTGNTTIIDSIVTANAYVPPVNSNPLNWQILSFTQNIPQGIFDIGDSLFISDLIAPLNGGSNSITDW